MLHAHFHSLCMHARMCTLTNIHNQLGRLILTYAENFVKIRLHLACGLKSGKNAYCSFYCALVISGLKELTQSSSISRAMTIL